ncbi:recombinase family protein [Vagococcus sp. BWB3-3]|uniref:Recombinase family protein n=1 Tax=Vagococcus allomyrinae TaxID=2794353 RepID=A0A940P9U2_9ENTE|nr:recombinase family protein [Vagococcus allomyrinae]MBP1040128.1 recombinase family protein [Vagococcus allomyrinae]
MAIYGYVRKGFPMNESTQLAHILTYNCDELFIEGALIQEETEWSLLVDKLVEEDTLVVMSLKAFGKNLAQLSEVVAQLRELRIRLISIEDQLDTHVDTSFYETLGLVATTVSECKSVRIRQQIRLAREIGKNIGRPTLDEETIKQIGSLYHDQKWSMRRIATECDVSLGSVYKYIHQFDPETVSV